VSVERGEAIVADGDPVVAEAVLCDFLDDTIRRRRDDGFLKSRDIDCTMRDAEALLVLRIEESRT